jgi:6-pyruvoyltetrahydropterin/6-carboxytetrahydropterin synthase
MPTQITKTFEISAAHFLPDHPICGKIHGHNYKVELTLEGKVNPKTGMLMDFGDVKDIFKKTIGDKLDHSTLNDFMKIPTAENIAKYVYKALKPHIKQLRQIRIYETETASATYFE